MHNNNNNNNNNNNRREKKSKNSHRMMFGMRRDSPYYATMGDEDSAFSCCCTLYQRIEATIDHRHYLHRYGHRRQVTTVHDRVDCAPAPDQHRPGRRAHLVSAWTLVAVCVVFLVATNARFATAADLQPSGGNSMMEAPPPPVEAPNSNATGTSSNNNYQFPPTGGDVEPTEEDDAAAAPHEVQKAVCTVTAGEVRASAEAVTTKTLKGVCGSAEMNMAFAQLEQRLFGELAEIKRLLLQQQQHDDRSSSSSSFGLPVVGMVRSTTITSTIATATPSSTEALRSSTPTVTLEPKRAAAAPQLKSLPVAGGGGGGGGGKRLLREHEVSQFNNTMLTDRDFKVFTYYWKLENFTARIASGASDIVESPIFSIKGKTLQIKAYLQHLHRDFLYLQLEHALLKSSNRNSIILDMGGLFKEIGNEKVRFKHKISILDQNNQRSKDLVSQELHNLDAGFLIPNSALLSSPYIKNDTLLIQIFLYL